MAVYDTEENDRHWMTRATLESMEKTVNWARHRLIVSDNGSCDETQALYDEFSPIIERLIRNGENIGTANALNRAWRYRREPETVCKIDNDVTWHLKGWADRMEMVFKKAPDVGICGLKRRDLWEWPIQSEYGPEYLSKLRPLPHKLGEPWLIVEEVRHVIGTCQAYSLRAIDKIGYLWQPGLYGFDDALACYRVGLVGLKCVFLHGDPIEHVDPGGTEFIRWKQRYTGEKMEAYRKALHEYKVGERPIYYDGGFHR